MSRYFFHLRETGQIHTDDDGSVFANDEAARSEAVLSARELLAAAIKSGSDSVPEAVVVADADGKELFDISMADLIPSALQKTSQQESE